MLSKLKRRNIGNSEIYQFKLRNELEKKLKNASDRERRSLHKKQYHPDDTMEKIIKEWDKLNRAHDCQAKKGGKKTKKVDAYMRPPKPRAKKKRLHKHTNLSMLQKMLLLFSIANMIAPVRAESLALNNTALPKNKEGVDGDLVVVNLNNTASVLPSFNDSYSVAAGSTATPYKLSYQPSFKINAFRKQLYSALVAPTSGTSEDYKKMGENLSIQGEGIFRIDETTPPQNNEEKPVNYNYVINFFGNQLEIASGLPLRFIKAMRDAYGFGYILNEYFEPADHPKDKDLIVYKTTDPILVVESGYIIPGDKITHAGIYRANKENFSIAPRVTVISKIPFAWDKSSYLFEHDPFWVPYSFGDLGEIYQLQQQKNNKYELATQADKTYSLHENGYLFFNRTPENAKMRNEVYKYARKELTKKIPQIKTLDDHITFTGNCCNYAFGQVFKTYHAPRIPECHNDKDDEKSVRQVIKKYFTATMSPQKGDLVVYYETLEVRAVHYGIYFSKSEDLIESKWGFYDGVYRHPPFHVVNNYGDYIRYYRLNFELAANETFFERLAEEEKRVGKTLS